MSTWPPNESASTPIWNLREIVAALRQSREHAHRVRHKGHVRELPSGRELEDVVQGISAALFPSHFGRADLHDEGIDYYVGQTLDATLRRLAEQVRRGLPFHPRGGDDDAECALGITHDFAQQLPQIRATLVSDLQAAYQGDPAATSLSEVLLCYPGMTAIIHHRIAHALYLLGCPLVARLIAGLAHARTGIDIHPGARIGASFFIDHGTGVVIGATTVIGENVRLYQAVTLGASSFAAAPDGSLVKGEPRHPIVEDDVVIYAGATILGRITVGRGSTIGGNVWLTHSIPPDSHIRQAALRQE